MTDYDVLCQSLSALDVPCVFGLPGTQNVPFFEALRRSNMRAIVPTDELRASFMAIGFSRASGTVGVVSTIPGPGFTYALTGIAEARLDSVPLLYIVQRPAESPGNRFQLQTLDQVAIVAPLVKEVFRVDDASDAPSVVAMAHNRALEGEPGPVMVEVGSASSGAEVAQPYPSVPGPEPASSEEPAEAVRSVLGLLRESRRPMLLIGQGGVSAAGHVQELAERLGCPVLTSTSGRGVLAEDHPLAVPSDLCDVDEINALITECDLVLALGIKFSHNGARGFRLRIPSDRLVHVDASQEVLGVNYPACLAIMSDVPDLLSGLCDGLATATECGSTWTTETVAEWRMRVGQGARGDVEPRVGGADPPTPERFFESIREVLPREACLVTDSGWHQLLARRYFRVLEPRGLLVPTDLQAMGFGLPAAIGAKLATPERAVVAVLGDGGFLMSGMELVTAVRERVSLPVIVLNDGRYGLIRIQQLRDYGHEHGVDSTGLDLEAFAAAVGVRFISANEDIRAPLSSALTSPGPTLIEVAVGDSVGVHRVRAAGLVRSVGRRLRSRRARKWFRSGD
jgi:acetolactate synthase-1/2/3 large subunit